MSSRKASTFGPEYQLVTDTQEIAHIVKNYVKSEDFDTFGSLFVKVGEGVYLEVWGSRYLIAYSDTQYHYISLTV